MALQINYTSPEFGVSVQTAYAKIESFRGNINEVTFTLVYYADVLARTEGKSPIGGFVFSIPYQDGLTYTSVYNYLKTLPGFTNAVDC